MAIVSAFGAIHIGFVCPHSKQPLYTQKYNTVTFNKWNIFQRQPTIMTSQMKGHFSAGRMSFNPAASIAAGRDSQQVSFNDEWPSEPFLLSLIKEFVWGLRSLFIFLAQQPSQLKYIEWPSFQNTLKTATLTLVLVALLIVALSSVDSALSFILTYVLRKST